MSALQTQGAGGADDGAAQGVAGEAAAEEDEDHGGAFGAGSALALSMSAL